MTRKKFISLILGLVIILLVIFLYLFLTRNPLLRDLTFLPQSKVPPTFLYALQGPPGDPMDNPMGVAVDSLDRVYVTDSDKHRVLMFDRHGNYVGDFGKFGLINGHFNYPYGIDAYNGRLYVADLRNGRIQVFSDKGAFLHILVRSFRQSEVGPFEPTALTVNQKNGDVYFADILQQRIVVVDQEGKVKLSFGLPGSGTGEFAFPNGLALDDKGNIYVADSNNARIQVFSPDGKKVIREFNGEQRGEGRMALPRGLAVDNSGGVWVADTLGHSINLFSGTNRVFRFGELGINEGELYFPNGLAVDRNGQVYVTERGLNRVSVYGYKLSVPQQ